MKFYYCTVTTFHNGTLIGKQGGRLLLDTPPENETIIVTWDNLYDIYHKFGLECSFTIYNFKKGRRVALFSDKYIATGDYADIKEWKTAQLGITLKFTYEEINLSIADVLKWHDGDKAIMYLKERGLKIQ